MRVEITEAMLGALRPPVSGRREVQDALVPQLSLRITSSDQRTWAVRARLPDGHRIRPTIGTYPQLSIAKARRAAQKMLGDIARGTDPTRTKRNAAAERERMKSEPRVKDRLEQWCEAKERDWSKRYAAEVKRLAAKVVIPKLGNRLLTQTNRADWVGLADELRRRTPAKAHWVYALISSFLNHCEAVGWGGENWINPLPRRGRDKIAPAVAARVRVLSDDELVELWHASAVLRPKSRFFVRLLVMTGCRFSEAANIAIGEINVLNGQWRIPPDRAKNRHGITLPLHPLVLEELTAIWPKERAGAGHRLLGSVSGSGLQAPSKVKQQVDQRLAGMEPWVFHDLRRSMRSGLSRLGVDKDIAERALNHLSHMSPMERVYNQHDYSREIVDAVTLWRNRVADILRKSKDNSLDILSSHGYHRRAVCGAGLGACSARSRITKDAKRWVATSSMIVILLRWCYRACEPPVNSMSARCVGPSSKRRSSLLDRGTVRTKRYADGYMRVRRCRAIRLNSVAKLWSNIAWKRCNPCARRPQR